MNTLHMFSDNTIIHHTYRRTDIYTHVGGVFRFTIFHNTSCHYDRSIDTRSTPISIADRRIILTSRKCEHPDGHTVMITFNRNSDCLSEKKKS